MTAPLLARQYLPIGDARGSTEVPAALRRYVSAIGDVTLYVTTTATLTRTQQVVVVTGGTYTINLPSSPQNKDEHQFIYGSGSGTVTVSDGGSFSQTIDAVGEVITAYYDETAWVMVEDNRTVWGGGDVSVGNLSASGTLGVTGTTTLAGALTMSAASPTATFGSYGGSPTQTFAKSAGGTSYQYFLAVDGTPSSGDKLVSHAADESLRIDSHDGVAFRNVVNVVNDADVRWYDGAQSVATTYIGNASYGVWTYEGVSGGDVTHVFGKAVGGSTYLLFRSVFNADTTGDNRFAQGTDEVMAWQVHDGTDFRDAIRVFNAANMALLGGAQGPSNVTIGGTVNATDEATLTLAAGASGLPWYGFVDNGNRLQFDEANQVFRQYVGDVEVAAFGATTIGFFAATPAAKVAVVAALTDNTGATPDNTIANVPAATAADVDVTAASLASTNTSLTAIENNISDLTAKVNNLLAFAKAHGLMASA